MYIREHESISVQPTRVLGVECHEFVEEDVSGRSATHGRTGVATVCLEGSIDLESEIGQLLCLPPGDLRRAAHCEKPNGIDSFPINLCVPHDCELRVVLLSRARECGNGVAMDVREARSEF